MRFTRYVIIFTVNKLELRDDMGLNGYDILENKAFLRQTGQYFNNLN